MKNKLMLYLVKLETKRLLEDVSFIETRKLTLKEKIIIKLLEVLT